MNLKELEKIIFETSSNLMRKSGEKTFKDGLVSNIKGKKIDNVYHIYGSVLNNINKNEFKTHIKVDLLNKKLHNVECVCQDFKEISINKKLFMCEHLTATAYAFLSLLYKKKSRQKDTIKSSSRDKKIKVEVDIDVKVICKSLKNSISYEVEFRFGHENKYLITDLRNFILHLDNKEDIIFNNYFVYNVKKYIISSNNVKIIDFIRKYVYEDKGVSVTGRNLIIQPNDLRLFLECIDEKRILFKYNGIEYKTFVLKKDLPLSFTLKEKDQYLVLTTHRKLPISLNSNKDVYFFEYQLYLPTSSQIERYMPLYSKFQGESEILYNKTLKSYNKIISLLKEISKDINIAGNVKEFAASSLKFDFSIYKIENNIYCDVHAGYSDEKINILKYDNNKMEFLRDRNKEEKVIMKLEYYKFIKRKDRFLFTGGDEELFSLLNTRENTIHALGNIILGRGLENIRIYNSSSIQIDLKEEGGYLYFRYNIKEVPKEEFRNIYESYKANNKFYKTRDNKFIDFEDDGIRSFINLLELLNVDEGIEKGLLKLEKNKAFYIIENLKHKNFKLGSSINLLENRFIKLNEKKVVLPKRLKAVLREYQISGFKWFENLSELEFGGILADEMGLGKTVQTIAFLTAEENKKSLIVTPTALIYNWKNEIEKFAPELKIIILHGNIKKYEEIINKLEDFDIILTTYGTLRNNINQYNELKFDYCIIDEAQNIKNSEAQITKTVKRVDAKVKFALTGTPIENNLNELWSIFDFIMPGYLYSKETFDEKFVSSDKVDLENLKLLIKPFVLRRTKKEVIKDLPDKIENQILVEMTSMQKALYNTYIKSIQEKIKNKADNNIEILTYLTKLRQICLDPSLIFDKYKGGSGKFKIAMSLIEEQVASGEKLLLFSQFTSVLKKIAKLLKGKEINYLYLDGSTRPKERIKLVNEFNGSDNPKVFLISLKAGGTGLNLTSATLVIHFDPWWNPAVENQATDRAHRIGQKSVVEVVKLVARGTIEEKIILLQEHKKELIDNIITEELKNNDVINRLSREELLKLFDRDTKTFN